jgi:hypothetical protein
MARGSICLRRFYGPSTKQYSNLTSLVVSPERARYIQEVLWPEDANRGRPGIIAGDATTFAGMKHGKRKRPSEDASVAVDWADEIMSAEPETEIDTPAEMEEPEMEMLPAD